MRSATNKKPTKQLPLLTDIPEVKPTDLLTDEDRQEQHRLRLIQERENDARHERWAKHNRGKFNFRMCPCNKLECKKARSRR